jgi:hypothetical protein
VAVVSLLEVFPRGIVNDEPGRLLTQFENRVLDDKSPDIFPRRLARPQPP